MKLLKQSKRAQVIAALVEGNSVRATVRMTDASKNAIRRLNRNCNTGSDGQAEKFYRDLKQRGICVRVAMEATGYSRWFERLLAELGSRVGLATQRRSGRSESRSRRPSAKRPDLCGGCCWKIAFRESGCRMQRIGICEFDND
jgi:hypothetical protein